MQFLAGARRTARRRETACSFMTDPPWSCLLGSASLRDGAPAVTTTLAQPHESALRRERAGLLRLLSCAMISVAAVRALFLSVLALAVISPPPPSRRRSCASPSRFLLDHERLFYLVAASLHLLGTEPALEEVPRRGFRDDGLPKSDAVA